MAWSTQISRLGSPDHASKGNYAKQVYDNEFHSLKSDDRSYVHEKYNNTGMYNY